MKKFKHDCDECVFLGHYERPPGNLTFTTKNNFDLYYCRGAIGTTLIARFGDEGDQYASGFAHFFKEENDTIKWSNPLRQAFLRLPERKK